MTKPLKADIALNPAFREAVPGFVEAVAHAVLEVRPLARRLEVMIGAMHDHLRFEIDKIDLAIQRAEWESRPTSPSLEELKARRETLEHLLKSQSSTAIEDTVLHLERFSLSLTALSQGAVR